MIITFKKLLYDQYFGYSTIVSLLLLCFAVSVFLYANFGNVQRHSAFFISYAYSNGSNQIANDKTFFLSHNINDYSIHGTATSNDDDGLNGMNSQQSFYVLPPINETITYSGDLTFTSSKPVQIESLNILSIDKSLKLPIKYGTLYTLNLKNYSVVPSVLLNQPVTTGTVKFSGNGLRVISTEPFIITFSFSGKKMLSVLSNNLTSGINSYDRLIGKIT